MIAAAAQHQRRVKLPSPRNLPIDTFVVLMMENRSFDHYLGWLPGADGRQAGLRYADRQGRKFSTHRLVNNFQGCAFLDPDHSWDGGRTEMAGGKMDGFLRAASDVFSIGYYAEHDLPFTPHVAKAFTAFDRFFCSLLASTYPNREYMHASQSFGKIDNSLPPAGSGSRTRRSSTRCPPRASRTTTSTAMCRSRRCGASPGLARSSQVQDYYERAAAGRLPALSFVDPAFAGEEQGTSGDEHPHGDVRVGQAFVSDVVHAFMESPQYKRGALFIVYDEWGGFFDHVRPPRVPDLRANPKLSRDFGQMGFRIPAVVVSPYARHGHVDHSIYGFESILKMIRYRYGLAPLTPRDLYANNIAYAFDWESKPRLRPPKLPTPAHIMATPCATDAPMAVGAAAGVDPAATAVPAPVPERPKPHDLATLVTSGYLERIGFDYRPATPATLYRHPSKLGMRV